MARSKAKKNTPLDTLAVPHTNLRVVDYEALRPIAAASNILDIAPAHFAAQSSRPLLGIHSHSLRHEVKLRGTASFDPASKEFIVSAVEFVYKAMEGDLEFCGVHGTMIVAYRLKPDLETSLETIQLFAEVNGTYHAWPYIRELVGSSVSRLGLGGVILPVWLAPKHFPPKGEFIVISVEPHST